MSALGYINKFIHLPFKEKLWMGEALVWLIWYSFLIYLVPFRWWESRIGQKMQPLKENELTLDQQDKIKKIRASVLRSNKVLGGLGKCFAISLTIRRMLQSRGIDSILYLGLRKKEFGQLLAHAWVSCGKLIIYGGKASPFAYSQLLTYSTDSLTYA